MIERGAGGCLFVFVTTLAACDGQLLNVGTTHDGGAQTSQNSEAGVGYWSVDSGLWVEIDAGGSTDPGSALASPDVSLISTSTSVAAQSAGGACVPWGQVATLAFTPETTTAPPVGAVGAALAQSASRLAGTWIGHATFLTVTGTPSWDLAIRFSAPEPTYGGDYGAITDDPNRPAFYYGSDIPCSLKTWQILDVDTAGLEGELNVTFGDSSSCSLPTWQGQFHAMTFDVTGNRLRFSFGDGGGAYPIAYDLWRVCTN